MKAAQLLQYGGREAIKTVDDAPQPQAAAGQVLVAVQAASVNPFDWKVREGAARQHIPLELPAILGGDLAGTVAAVGEGVTEFQVGDAVYGSANSVSGHGSFAEFAAAKVTSLAPKPEAANFATAAALPLVACSAYIGLVELIKLQPGQKILIHGGAGGIGAVAVQLAKHLGAYVATTVSGTDLDYAKELGADEVIDYKDQDFSSLLKDYDAVFDTAGGEAAVKSYPVLKPGGILVSMTEQPREDLMAQYGVTALHETSGVSREHLLQITPLVEDGTLRVNIDKTFPLDQAAEALEYLKTGHPRGKVVILPIDQ